MLHPRLRYSGSLIATSSSVISEAGAVDRHRTAAATGSAT
jgi:hypothetical protein